MQRFGIKELFSFMLVCVLAATVYPFAAKGMSAYAASDLINGSDGTYSLTCSLDGLVMGGGNFDKNIVVEKLNGVYYLSFTQKDSSHMRDMKIVIGGKTVGSVLRSSDGKLKTYTYTLSEANIQKDIPISVFITAMGKTINFFIRPNLSSAVKISETIDNIGERPAEFVPVFDMAAQGDYQASVGSIFAVPNTSAMIGTEPCEVTLAAYYIKGGEKEEVEVVDNRFALQNVGEYRLIYTAISRNYKTSILNSTYTILEFTINSVAGAIDLAKFDDINNVVPDSASLLARQITGGVIFDIASTSMKKLADNFEVIKLNLIDADGSDISLDTDIKLYIKAKASFDRNKIVVYRLEEDGSLSKLSAKGYGDYVVFDTSSVGTFIVCVPGVAFRMPMWGYAIIWGMVIVMVTGAITIIVLRRKKQKNSVAE